MQRKLEGFKLTTPNVIFRVLLIILLVEVVNELCAVFGPTQPEWHHLFESVMIVLICGPVLWIILARPLRQFAEQKKLDEIERSKLMSLMESTIESTTDGIVVYDMNRHVTVFNRQYCKMWGLSDEMAKEDSVVCINDYIRSQLENPEDFEGHECHVFDSPGSVYHDVLRLKDGRVIERVCTPQNVCGQIVGRVSCYRDVTERVLAQKAISESESRFRQIFEQSADAIFLLNADCTSVIDLNQVAVKMFRYQKSELLGRPPDFIFNQDDCSAIKAQTVDSDTGYWIDILHARRKDGDEMFVSVRCRRIELVDQQVLLCTIRDISSRVRAEEENRAIEAKLIQTNKMTSLGVLVAGMAHEINNPNNFILVSSELLYKSWVDAYPILVNYQKEQGDYNLGGVPFSMMKNEIPELLQNIIEGSKRIRDIVNGLKNFAREGGRGMHFDVDINEVVFQSTTIISHHIRRHTNQFHVETDPDLPHVYGNQHQIEQVVINLLLNALQSLPNPDRGVRVKTHYDTATSMVCVEVCDQGVGIPDNIASRILEPFFTTRIDRGGTGLGLSISKSIINDHNGSITFSSSASGSTFTICIPSSKIESSEVNSNA